jgi:hypothetical protein
MTNDLPERTRDGSGVASARTHAHTTLSWPTAPPTTILIAAVVGFASVAATPLLLVRRLQRLNLPGALRVVE